MGAKQTAQVVSLLSYDRILCVVRIRRGRENHNGREGRQKHGAEGAEVVGSAVKTVDEDEDVGAGAAGPIACAEDLDRKLGGGTSAARHHSTKSKRRAGCGGAIQKS